MQTEDVVVLKVKAFEAVESVQDLKNNIKLLKEEVDGATIGTEEYTAKLNELKLNQNALKDAMYATSSSLDVVKESAAGASESYNSLVHRMAALKEEWRSVDQSTDEGKARFAELSVQIKDTNDKLKKMDEGIGNHQRNVGNYKSALDGLVTGFKATAGSASSAIAPIAGMTTGLKAMSATPAVAVLGLLANVLSKIIADLKTSETNANATAKAMSFLSGAGDLVRQTMQTLGKAIGKVAEGLSNLALRIFPKLREAAELRNEITQKEIDLSFAQRRAIEQNADAELQVAKIRQQAADKEGVNAKERISLLEKASAIELSISQRNVQIAKQQYEIEQLKAKTAENSREANDALAQAYANVVKAETDYYTTTRRLVSQIAAARKEETANAEKAANEERKAKQRMIEINKSLWQVRLETAKEGSEDEFFIRQAILEDEYLLEKEKAMSDIQDADEKVKTLEVIEQKYYEKRLQMANEFADAQHEQERQHLENQMNSYQEGSFEYLNKQIELKKFEMDTLTQMDTENDEAFYARKIQAEKDYLAAKKALTAQQITIMQGLASATSAILGSIADIYEEDAENNVQSAKKAKAVRIASATIDTISGAIGAYMQSVATIPPPYGIILGAVQAAAVTAAGIAQIAKIKNTQIGTSESGSSASASGAMSANVAAPNVNAGVHQTSLITTAQDEQRLNSIGGNQRVYILQSDIEAAGNSSKVRVAEATF